MISGITGKSKLQCKNSKNCYAEVLAIIFSHSKHVIYFRWIGEVMGLLELLLIGLGLSMDAFAVSACKGLALPNVKSKEMLICGSWFGGFQMIMPFIGFLLANTFAKYIVPLAPWVAFFLLLLIGGHMIKEACPNSQEENLKPELDCRTMFLLAVATSIDAFAVGVTFALVPIVIISSTNFFNTLLAVVIIGIITFIISAFGVKVGNIFGCKFKSKAELVGGIILIIIGFKILIEHLLF